MAKLTQKDFEKIPERGKHPTQKLKAHFPEKVKAPLCKGSWHGEAVTEGL